MRRALAISLMLWYAVLATGFHLHIHYCCGQVADFAINTVARQCSDSCSSHVQSEADKKPARSCCAHSAHHVVAVNVELERGCSITKHCCSSDDLYIALDEAHDKPSVDVPAPLVKITLEKQEEGALIGYDTPLACELAPRDGPPFWILYQCLRFCDEEASGLKA